MLKVCKFGGSSLADAGQFRKVAGIIAEDPCRKAIVVSAPGKRFAEDKKITDLLYLCHERLQSGLPCSAIFGQIRARYTAIEDALSLDLNIGQSCDAIFANLKTDTPLAYLISRGEYLCAKLMAKFLDIPFIDSARWLFFRSDGTVDAECSEACLKELSQNKSFVTPGFYGMGHDGTIRLFSRGGSDITGALCANYLSADVYENWTDVDGILAADPAVINDPKTIPCISYSDLTLLSASDLQVLHPSAIAPAREKEIPLLIRNTNRENGAYTTVCSKNTDFTAVPVIFGRKTFAEKRIQLHAIFEDSKYAEAVISAIKSENIEILQLLREVRRILITLHADDYPKALTAAYRAVYEKCSLD